MDAQTAVELINEIHFMPGWRVSAELDWWSSSRLVTVTCEVDTVNSNRDMALQGYPQAITIAPVMTIDPAQFTDADVLYVGILGWIVDVFKHEAREFFRVGNDMEAPFHPHKPEGDARLAAALA